MPGSADDSVAPIDLARTSLAALASLSALVAPIASVTSAALFAPAPLLAAEHVAPPLMLAGVYSSGVGVAQYWVSEKLDGVRAYWNGSRLLTRNGNVIHAPEWFTRGWPAEPLDGELWIGRNAFETTMATVRDAEPDEAAWRRVRFQVFDLPAYPGDFSQRSTALNRLVDELDRPWVKAVLQYRVPDAAALDAFLDEVIAQGGEGLILHRAESVYTPGRSDAVLKLKPSLDGEATVVGHEPGKGKHEGKLGALRVRREDGVEFLIGTGFTDAERSHPPVIGTTITYAYQGVTARGLPRFARYVRKRPAE